MSKFYITTSIAYANAAPHLGHALELLQADIYARYHRLLNDETFFLTGTDEHGAKNAKAAEKAKKTPQEFVNQISEKFIQLSKNLEISNDEFIRTSDQKRHWPIAQTIWKKLKESEDLYKKNYKGLYCAGHEAFMKPSELKDGICQDHKLKPEVIKEKNYFFRLTKYSKKIIKKVESGELKITPQHRANEILELLKDSEDISVSRPRKDLTWGIPVPNDKEHTMYVWIDALTNYLSGIINDPTKENIFSDEKFLKYWPADLHLVGKDILRFHAIIWPAMLLSVGLDLPKQIFVHGHITVDGEKMSKTVGNIIDPFQLIEKYGTDATRYFLLREIPSYEDGDFSYKKFEQRYTADLVNNIGNLINRVAVLHQKYLNSSSFFKENLVDQEIKLKTNSLWRGYNEEIQQFRLHEALNHATELSTVGNKFIDEHKPWEVIKDRPEHFEQIMNSAIFIILNLAWLLKPFLPETSSRILEQFGVSDSNSEWNGQKVTTEEPKILFPKLNL